MKNLKYILVNIGFLCLFTFSLLFGDKDMQIFSYLLGIISGMWAVAIVFTIKSFKSKNKVLQVYDERQMLKRGKCYEKAFLTLVFLLILDGFIRLMFSFNWSDYLVGVVTLILISLTVFTISAILNDAYEAINSNVKSLIIFSLFISAFNIFSFLSQVITKGLIIDNKVSPYILNLITAIFTLTIGLTLIYKKLKEIKVNEES